MSDRAEEVAKKLNEEFRYRPFHDYSDMIAAAIRAYAEEAVRVWRGDLWLAHGHSGIIYGDDGEMACSACGVDYKREPNPSRVVAAALHARAEEARREERDVAAKDAQMRYEDGYDCGVKDEGEACAVFLMRCAGIALEEARAPWRGAGREVAEMFRQAAVAIRARGPAITASPDLPSTDTRVKGLVPRATTADDFEAGDIARGEGQG